MDEKAELAKAKWVLIGGALFLMSCCISFDELAYLTSGQDAEATIKKVYPSTSRTGTKQTVEYAWAEPDGTQRKGMLTKSTDWVPPADGKLPIRYTPGADGRSRMLGHPAWIGIGLFVGSLLFVAVFMFRMWQLANEDVRPKKRAGR